ncbi:MAG: hypothetical protein U5K51_16990 [Flavobacteriaceae bacterium]|nr:hypothetical protein [Flavobacteriaceae bacterium]
MKKFSVFSKSFALSTKAGLAFLFVLMCTNLVLSQTASNESGWYLTSYSFKDGSMQKESVLMGTSSKMKDVVSFKGDKGNIEITHNRNDLASGKLLAGVTYQVTWTDPPAILEPGTKSSFDYE